MPGLLLNVTASTSCFHRAPATTTPTQVRVVVSGQPVVTTVNQLMVTGCLFQVPIGTGTKPQPCVRVQWGNASSRFLVVGLPALLQTPPGPGAALGVCQSAEQIPQGAPSVTLMQTRVLGV